MGLAASGYKSDLSRYRRDVYFTRSDGNGGLEYIRAGWQIVNYGELGEGYEPVDFSGTTNGYTGAVEKQVTDFAIYDNYGFSPVTGGNTLVPVTGS